MWADGLQTFAQSRSQPGVAKIKADRTGAVGGINFGFGGLRVGVNGGYSSDDVELLGRASTAKVTTKSAGASLGWATSATGYAIQVGGTYAWHDIDAARTVDIPGIAGSLRSGYQAHTAQMFAEASLPRSVRRLPVYSVPSVRPRLDQRGCCGRNRRRGGARNAE